MTAAHDEPNHGINLYLIYLLLTSTLGPLLFGYHLAELNAPQAVLTCAEPPPGPNENRLPQCIPMTPSQLGLVNSILTLGGLVGALTIGSVTSRVGRLPSMRLTTPFLISGPICESLAPHIAVLSLGRFLSGLGVGAALVAVPIYISEIAPPGRTGFFGAFTQIMTNVGIFLTQLIGLFLSKASLWRIILGVAGVIGTLQLVGLGFAVESPKWLVSSSRRKEAEEVLRKIRGPAHDVDAEMRIWDSMGGTDRPDNAEEASPLLQPDDQRQTFPPQAEIDRDSSKPLNPLSLILDRTYLKPLILTTATMTLQQFTGINALVIYGIALLRTLLPQTSGYLNLSLALLNLLVTLAASPLPDRLGRRPVLLLSLTGIAASSALLGTAIIWRTPPLAIASVLSFVTSFALGLGPIPFMLSAELVGPEAVGATQSWALAANWASTFVVAGGFPVVDGWLGEGRVFFVFAAVAVMGVAFIWVFLPETRVKGQEESARAHGD